MSLDIDGFSVLRSIAGHPNVFDEVAREVTATARSLVVKQIKNKTTNLKRLREIRVALEADAFNLILDGMPDPQIRSLLRKLDKHNPELRSSSPQWCRQQILALTRGSVEPATKSKSSPKQKPAKRNKSAKPAAPEILNYVSAGATRKRRVDHSGG
jgi:hypothetical protein